MWMVPPRLLCNKHLGGEHLEAHMLAGCIARKKSLAGFISRGLVELDRLKQRHDALAMEMLRRGMNHDSDMSPQDAAWHGPPGEVDTQRNLRDLTARCADCARRIGYYAVYGEYLRCD